MSVRLCVCGDVGPCGMCLREMCCVWCWSVFVRFVCVVVAHVRVSVCLRLCVYGVDVCCVCVCWCVRLCVSVCIVHLVVCCVVWFVLLCAIVCVFVCVACP